VAHRALVAYERAEGRYDVHTSRWGGLDCRLSRAITPTDPYANGSVDPVPRVVSRSFEDVLTMVDLARHEAVYRVGVEYDITTYLPLWFGLDHYLGATQWSEAEREGLLVAVEDAEEAADFRAWLRAAKAALAEAVSTSALELSETREVLEKAVRRRAMPQTERTSISATVEYGRS
jgi:hypothetical protein